MNDSTGTSIQHRIGADGSLTLSDVSGSIRLQGVDGDEVTVVARGSRGEPRLSVRRSEGALVVEPEQRASGFLGGTFGAGSSAIDFEVRVPRGARVDISAVSADINASGLHGEQSYKSVSGDIDISDTGGSLSLASVSGDVAVAGDRAVELTGTSTSGDVLVAAPRIDLLRVRTVSGDVEVRGSLRAEIAHTVETVSGDLRVDSNDGVTVEIRRALDMTSRRDRNLVVGNGAARIRFRSMSGDVALAGEMRQEYPPTGDTVADEPVAEAADEPPAVPVAAGPDDERALEILRAVERGELDVDEASRLLEVADRG